MKLVGLNIFAFATIGGRIAQAGSLLFLAHYLNPTGMGVVAILAAVYMGLETFTNLGFDKYLVYKTGEDFEDHKDSYDAVWTMQIIRGGGIFLLTLIGSQFVGYVVAEADQNLPLMIYFVGGALLLLSFKNPSVVWYERKGNFNYSAIFTGFSYTIGAIVTVVAVVVLMSPWAYILGIVSFSLVMVVFTHKHGKYQPVLKLKFAEFKEVFLYSKYILYISIVSYIVVQFENFYISASFSLAMLGCYYTWARIIYLPREVVGQVFDRLFFSKVCHEKRLNSLSYTTMYKKGMWAWLSILSPIYALVYFYGDLMVGVLAGEEWLEYSWLAPWMIGISLLYLISTSASPFMLAYMPKFTGDLRFAEALVLITLTIYLGKELGLKGVVIASLVSALLATIVRIYILAKHFFSISGLASILLSGVGIVAMYFIIGVGTTCYFGDNVWGGVVLSFFSAAVCLLTWIFHSKLDQSPSQ